MKTNLKKSHLKNRHEIAVALSFNAITDEVPVVAAIGELERAKEMKRLARRYGVPIHHSSKLADQLSELREKDVIPQQFYREVAEVFVKVKRDKSKLW